jgi:vancomycin resistance protein YoaR
MNDIFSPYRGNRWLTLAGVALGALAGVVLVSSGAYAWYFGDRIAPNAWVGSVAVGGVTRDEARQGLEEVVGGVAATGVRLSFDGERVEVIPAGAIGYEVDIGSAVDDAFFRGHDPEATDFRNAMATIGALRSRHVVDAPVRVNAEALVGEIDTIARLSESARRDIRLSVSGVKVSLLTDTAPGRVIDRTAAFTAVMRSLTSLDREPVRLTLVDDLPVADASSGPSAVTAAQKILARPLTLQYEDVSFFIGRERIGQWMTSAYEGTALKPSVSRTQIAAYVTTVATRLNVDPVPPVIKTEGGRVTSFTPSRVGRAVQEDELIGLITDTLLARTQAGGTDTLAIPVKTTAMALRGLEDGSGITELIGKATTPFTGSPKNRIANIKNGVKFLSGSVIQPGQEFSTIGALGVIDNTTGYLPELVIKGDRTTPEFGGGLCQVSTTLFRAVMDAALPITERRNHSVRIGYYEKDGFGNKIGPGLDATIYQPNPDFKFRNDTAHPVLLIGYVTGDKVTFELYGTRDGRTSQIIGPKVLSESSAPEPVYLESTDIPVGTTKQVELPRPGGHTVATYVVTYPDGRSNTQTFESWYRRSPAMYLRGVAVLSTPLPVSPPTPTP